LALNHFDELPAIDRLGGVIVAAGPDAPIAVARNGAGRQCDDGGCVLVTSRRKSFSTTGSGIILVFTLLDARGGRATLRRSSAHASPSRRAPAFSPNPF
jgi:hypothetical protein